MTHHANRIRRRTAARHAAAGPEDMKRWAKLVLACAQAARDPGGDPKAVARGRRGVRGRIMPPGQAVVGSVFDRLCRMADRWPGMLGVARIGEAGALKALVDEAAAVLDALERQTETQVRADIDG